MKAALVIACLALLTTVARADGARAGWKLLGKKQLTDAADMTVVLRQYDGNIDELELVVEGGWLEVTGVTVGRAKGADVRAEVDATIKRETWSHRLELTDNQDTLESVTLGLRALFEPPTIRVFGRDRQNPVSATGATSTAFPAGLRLATLILDGSAPATIPVGDPDRWTGIGFRAHCDMDLLGFELTSERGTSTPGVTIKLRDGARAQAIELAKPRALTAIEFDYTLIGVTTCSVAVIGFLPDAPEVRPDPGLSAGAWTLLGEDEVDLLDDYVEINRANATWDQIAVVAEGDPVHVEAVELTLAGKSKKKKKKKRKVQREEVAQDLTGEERVRVIELAGGRRAVSKVRLQVKKLWLGAETRVQIYAR